MFGACPVEIIEQILLYLNIKDILSVFSAFNKQYSVLSDYFWRKICTKEDFLRAYKNQEWYECFQNGVNKKLGRYVQLQDVPLGVLEHIYLKSLVICDTNKSENIHNIYYLDDENKFQLSQQIIGNPVQFRTTSSSSFMIIQKETCVLIHVYSHESKKYEYYRSVLEKSSNIFGVSDQYCTSYDFCGKRFCIYDFYNNSVEKLVLPLDVKFLIEKILHLEHIVISMLSFTEGYKIKVYDIISKSWILDLVCFGSTGLTNEPNIWVGSNFIGCCDITYRLRGIYFGPFKVWNKKGNIIFETDIQPSNKHYLRCFFKEEHVILTTSDNTINVFNNLGKSVSNFHTSTSFLDVKLSTGNLLFILLEEKDYVEILDWRLCLHLYSIRLSNQCCKSLYSDFLFCPIKCEKNDFEVINFS